MRRANKTNGLVDIMLFSLTPNSFNALVDNKPFSDQPVKNKQEEYEKHTEMSKNNGYTTSSALDFSDHQNYYKLVG